MSGWHFKMSRVNVRNVSHHYRVLHIGHHHCLHSLDRTSAIFWRVKNILEILRGDGENQSVMNGTKMSQTEVKLIAVSVLWVWPVRGDDFIVTADNIYICKEIGPTSQQSAEERGEFCVSSPPVSHCWNWTAILLLISWEVAAWPDPHFYHLMWYSISEHHVIVSHSASQQCQPALCKEMIEVMRMGSVQQIIHNFLFLFLSFHPFPRSWPEFV